MSRYEEVIDEVLKTLDNETILKGLKRSVKNISPKPFEIISKWSYIIEFTEYLRRVKEEVFKNIEYYIDKTLKSVEKIAGYGYYAKTHSEVYDIIDHIIGDESKIIVKSKSMVTEEIKLREHLVEKGHLVYETDLGELLIQISGERPMHTTAPAIHMTRERAIELLRKMGIDLKDDAEVKDIVYNVRLFLREIFIKADIGITGANAVSADTGSIFLISNEGNIRNTSNLPPIHIAVTGVEKILPTMKDAFIQVLVQAAYAGLYPPTYISVISGPSSTADIELRRVYGVHGPREYHLILYDGGRLDALRDNILSEQLYCIKCGRCQIECPIWDLVGNIWGGSVYGGPMGIGWTAITEDHDKSGILSLLCLNCSRCWKVCPMNIDLPKIISYLKRRYIKKLLS